MAKESATLRNMTSRLRRRLGGLVLPRTCLACGQAIESDAGELCLDCWTELEQAVGGGYCKTCGEDRDSYLLRDGRCTRCLTKRPGLRLDGFARVGRYDGTLKRLILAFKRHFVLDRLLGRMLSDAVAGRFDPAKVDLWVPVPSHWRRRLTVGFQPTALLARAVARRWRGRVEPAIVAKRYVPPFHLRGHMSATARAEEIKGVFAVSSSYRLNGQTVCVIDDVTTTGATLGEAKRALRDAGAGRIMAAVLARASSASLGADRNEATGASVIDAGGA